MIERAHAIRAHRWDGPTPAAGAASRNQEAHRPGDSAVDLRRGGGVACRAVVWSVLGACVCLAFEGSEIRATALSMAMELDEDHQV
jgi:hypothetical protein